MHLAGCATPAQREDALAAELGYRRMVLQGDGFHHVAYFKEGHAPRSEILHVYLEGDGSPWLRRRVPAIDPTPHNPLMLRLMALDSAPALYLGRPCYHGLQEAACTPEVWTSGRYAEGVVRSMAAALESAASDYSSIVLLGHSGGGTLAMLLAERQPKVTAVVTVAANLDTDRWAALHQQQTLSGSLNPARRPPLRQGIMQMHYAGDKDDNVPPQLVRDAAARQPGAMFKVYAEQDHSCCWQNVWANILSEL
jgi:hypothetical protein